MNVKSMRTVRILTVAIRGAVTTHVGLPTVGKMPIVIVTGMKGIANVFMVLLEIL